MRICAKYSSQVATGEVQVGLDGPAMKGFVADIEDLTEASTNFRDTGKGLQLVLMSMNPSDDIGEEVHKDRDQFFRVKKAKAKR
jgi:hypothetical protein